MADASSQAWRCTVCGYVHRGGGPPESCPVCGASASDFEAHTEPAPERSATAATRWRCAVCGYIHDGPEPPEECPLCGAAREQFEPVADEPLASAAAGSDARVVILGGGIAGLAAAEGLRGVAPDARIVLVSKEPTLPYYRLNLTRYLAGEITREDLPVHPEAWYHDQRIERRQGIEAARLDLDARTVELRDGERLPFDRLILATGVRSSTHLARQAGLTVKKGVVVDECLCTSHPAVLAAGDLAEHQGVLYGNWSVAQYQGGIAGRNAAGLATAFGGVPRSHTLKVLGIDAFSIGQFLPLDGSYRIFALEADATYQSFVFRDGLLVGANLLGTAALASLLKKAIESKTDYSGLLARHPSAAQVAEFLAA